jgi:hypothetical protein
MKKANCLYCKKEFTGRTGKKFCDAHCKSAYHYQKQVEGKSSFFTEIDKQLKLNRKLLKQFNKAGKATIREEKLKEVGFNEHFFTHYWRNRTGAVYYFCYEFGFQKIKENGKVKYSLVEWQPYMKK